jgi:RasGEF N-terminal motif
VSERERECVCMCGGEGVTMSERKRYTHPEIHTYTHTHTHTLIHSHTYTHTHTHNGRSAENCRQAFEQLVAEMDRFQDAGTSECEMVKSARDRQARESRVDLVDLKFSKRFKDRNNEAQVRAGSLVRLVERLTYEKRPSVDFMKAFLLSYRSFTDSSYVLLSACLFFMRIGVLGCESSRIVCMCE